MHIRGEVMGNLGNFGELWGSNFGHFQKSREAFPIIIQNYNYPTCIYSAHYHSIFEISNGAYNMFIM